MFRFEHPEMLQLLWLLPTLVIAYYLAKRFYHQLHKRLGDPKLIERVISGKRHARRSGTLIMTLSVTTLLALALANPQFGIRNQEIRREASDIWILLDISNSMLAEDVAPSRLAKAQYLANRVLETAKGNRFGLVLFAGNAWLQMPLTTDHAASTLFINSANPDMAPTQGTAIGAALDRVLESAQPDAPATLLLFSDGENHEDNALDWAAAVAGQGHSLFTIGLGTAGGGFIPVKGNLGMGYKRSVEGVPVRTRLDEEALTSLAREGNGRYFDARMEEEQLLKGLSGEIAKSEKRFFEERSYTDFESYYQYPVGLALLLVGLMFLPGIGPK